MLDTAFMGGGALHSGSLRWEEPEGTSSVHAFVVGSLTAMLAQSVGQFTGATYSCILSISL